LINNFYKLRKPMGTNFDKISRIIIFFLLRPRNFPFNSAKIKNVYMPQLDFYSFSALTLYSSFTILTLIFILHTYFLPKLAEALKIRNKIKRNIQTIQPFHEDEETQLYSMIIILLNKQFNTAHQQINKS